MTLPQGLVWQSLRQLSLDAVPEGVLAAPGTPPSLAAWLRQGAYTVASATTGKVVLEGAAVDVGAALLAEAGLLLDHAQEHAIQVRHQLASGRFFSPAWMSVSVYYWSFYVVLALTRLTGETPWFLSADEAALLKGLAPSLSGSIGPGPRVLACKPASTGTMRPIEIRKPSQTRVHDAVWKLWFSRLRLLVQPLTSARSTSAEVELYAPQILVADRLGDAWPAEFRNAVNYVPGLAYGAARKRTPTARFGGIPTAEGLTIGEAVSRMVSDASAISAGKVERQLAECTKALVSTTFVLDALANTLFEDVAERRAIDRRWLAGRKALARSQCPPFQGAEWPVRGTAA